MNIPAHVLPILTAAWMALCVSVPCEAGSVQTGDTREEVEEQWGRPQGTVRAGDLDIWTYPRGEIEFQDDRVIQVNWMTESDYKAKQQGIRTQALERKKAKEATARAQREEAEARKNEILADSEYATWTSAEKVAVWDEYYKSFPTAEKIGAQIEAQTALKQDIQEAEKKETAQAERSVEEAPPRLSGSKKKKARRGAGKVKPEDRPSYMSRQTVNIKDREKQPSYLSDQSVRIPAQQKSPSYLSGQTINLTPSAENRSFRSD
jgi:hypothetical protein